MSVGRVNILGVGISKLNLAKAQQCLEVACSDENHVGFVTVTGVHGVMESQKDPELRAIHNRSFLSTPDGMPMVWLGQAYGAQEMDRVYGPELMEQFFEQTRGTGTKHFLFGGADGVVEELKEAMCQRYPGTDIVGVYTPPFRPLTSEEERDLYDALQRLQPHCFWVGLSTPKQERFMDDFLTKYPEINKGWGHGFTMFGVGAAFDFHSGKVEQAPYWVQRSGLEWLFRVTKEPRRLWRRYSVNNTKFIFAILGQLLNIKKYQLD